MATTSRIPAAITYLVATYTAHASLGAAVPPVAVLDGPRVTGDPLKLALWVGVDDPDPDGAPLGASGDQRWKGVGGRNRDEEFSIFHTAEAWDGGADLASLRTAAFGIVAAVETIVWGSVDLGGTVLMAVQGVTGHQLRQAQTSIGAVARVTFRVDCKARLSL